MRRIHPLLPVLAVAGLLAAGCSDDPEMSGTSGTPRATAAPTATASAAPEPTESEPPFPADTTKDEKEASGGPLSVTTVRVAGHEGYDRVVFELDGKEAGSPGWRVEYTDDPRQDGSGNPVDVEGDAVLAVLIDGVGYPFDTGVEAEAETPALPAGLQVVQDVELGSVFEGVYQAWIGVSSKAPFRVFRLADPARVVVDIRHG